MKNFEREKRISLIREKLLNILYEITSVLIFEADLKKLLQMILEKIGKGVGACSAVIWVWDKKEKYFKNVASYNWPKELEEFVATEKGRLKGGGVGKAVSEMKPYLMKNAWEDPTLPEKYRPILKRVGIKAFFCFPLITRGRAFGSLNVYFPEFREDVSDEEVFLFSIIANQISALIENVKMYEELKEKVEELEKFQKIAIGRELRIVELKQEIEKLKEELRKSKS
jgi:GAF domain-containing protein